MIPYHRNLGALIRSFYYPSFRSLARKRFLAIVNMHVKRELCVSVCVSRNLKPSDKKKSGLHIEVPSVYMAGVQSVSVYRWSAAGIWRQRTKPCFSQRGAAFFYKFVYSTETMLFLYFSLLNVKAIH